MTTTGPDGGAAHVYVVDDDAALRDELAEALAIGGYRVRTFASGEALLAEHADLAPGCVVLDVNMPGCGGREVQDSLRTAGSPHQVVMLTGAATVSLAVAALHAGAADFIEKPLHVTTLKQAVARALARLRQDEQRRSRRAAAQALVDRLSDREIEVLGGLVLGLPNKIIAFRLGLSTRTVEAYRAHVMDKMAVASLSEAVRIAIDAGLEPGGAILRTQGPA